jgi:hypothetical protein
MNFGPNLSSFFIEYFAPKYFKVWAFYPNTIVAKYFDDITKYDLTWVHIPFQRRAIDTLCIRPAVYTAFLTALSSF